MTKDVPKSFAAALQDPKWGDPARLEWATLLEAQTLVAVDRADALEAVGAEPGPTWSCCALAHLRREGEGWQAGV